MSDIIDQINEVSESTQQKISREITERILSGTNRGLKKCGNIVLANEGNRIHRIIQKLEGLNSKIGNISSTPGPSFTYSFRKNRYDRVIARCNLTSVGQRENYIEERDRVLVKLDVIMAHVFKNKPCCSSRCTYCKEDNWSETFGSVSQEDTTILIKELLEDD